MIEYVREFTYFNWFDYGIINGYTKTLVRCLEALEIPFKIIRNGLNVKVVVDVNKFNI